MTNPIAIWLLLKKGAVMHDIDLARRLLAESKLSFVAVKDGVVIASSVKEGVAPFFEAVKTSQDTLRGAVLADRVVGRAIAMLCIYAGISTVYAALACESAINLLRDAGIEISATQVVPFILNKTRTGLCPFEKLTRDIGQPSEAFSALKSFFEAILSQP